MTATAENGGVYDKYFSAGGTGTVSVIELGAGLGLCGILASYMPGAKVVITDGDTKVLEKTQANIDVSFAAGPGAGAAEGARTVVAKKLRWGIEHVEAFLESDGELEGLTNAGGRFDVVMGSDIIYDEKVVPDLFDTVGRLMDAKRGIFLLGYERRNVPMDYVMEVAQERGIELKETLVPGHLFAFGAAAAGGAKRQ